MTVTTAPGPSMGAAPGDLGIPLQDPRWLRFVSGHPDATIFHNPAWAQLLADCYGYDPLLFAVAGADGGIAAGIPLVHVDSRLTGRRVVGLAFTDFCPPLLGAGVDGSSLAGALEQTRTREAWPRVEVRWGLGNARAAFAGDTVYRHTTVLTADPEAVFKTFKKTRVRQPVGQARGQGVVARHSQEWDAMRTYFDLHLRTRRRLGVPTQPLKFFRLVWERLIAQGLGFVTLALHDGRPVAGGVFLRWNGVTTYKFGASEADAWRLRPNHLLLWEAIQRVCAEGDRLFDWGRTDLANEGLRTFKLGWADEEQVTYTVFADSPPAASGGRAQAALGGVIRRSPLWVSRAVGKMLYGHVA